MPRKVAFQEEVSVRVSLQVYYAALMMKQENSEKFANVSDVINHLVSSALPDHHERAKILVETLGVPGGLTR